MPAIPFHFFGIELSTDLNADEAVQGLDFTPCYENIIARNTISGGHYAGVFMGEDAFMNDIFDNTFMDCTDWAMESLSEKYNSTLNNMANMPPAGSNFLTVRLMPRGCYMKQTLQNRFPRRWLLLAFVLNFAIAAAALLPT